MQYLFITAAIVLIGCARSAPVDPPSPAPRHDWTVKFQDETSASAEFLACRSEGKTLRCYDMQVFLTAMRFELMKVCKECEDKATQDVPAEPGDTPQDFGL